MAIPLCIPVVKSPNVENYSLCFLRKKSEIQKIPFVFPEWKVRNWENPEWRGNLGFFQWQGGSPQQICSGPIPPIPIPPIFMKTPGPIPLYPPI